MRWITFSCLYLQVWNNLIFVSTRTRFSQNLWWHIHIVMLKCYTIATVLIFIIFCAWCDVFDDIYKNILYEKYIKHKLWNIALFLLYIRLCNLFWHVFEHYLFTFWLGNWHLGSAHCFGIFSLKRHHYQMVLSEKILLDFCIRAKARFLFAMFCHCEQWAKT